MHESGIVGVSAIVILGISAQWLGWRLRIPSILLLLVFGVVAGPVTGLIDPQHMLGDSLFPFVTLSVWLILFEGGLSLRFNELKEIGSVVRNLILGGSFITLLIATLAAYFVLDLPFSLSVLMGSILVVTGPTVIGPLLRHIRPIGKVGSVAKWEGIMNDPVGALFAVLVFEAILSGELHFITFLALEGVLQTLLFGTTLGLAGTVVLILMLRLYWIPDFLHSPVALMLVTACSLASNMLQPESGLFTATLMGVLLANQKYVNIHKIVEFKENLRVLLISSLFVLLSASLKREYIDLIDGRIFLFLLILIVIARPLAVWFSSRKSTLDWRDKTFLCWMAPRGIVAAAMATLFSRRLVEAGYEQAEQIVPYIFVIIGGTVALYGLTAGFLALRLKLAKPNPQGTLIIGSHSWARTIAKVLKEEEIPVIVVDTNWSNISRARMDGLKASYANIFSEKALDEIDLGGIGRMLALTSNDEVNSLASLHFGSVLGTASVYQLPSERDAGKKEKAMSQRLRGRLLFSKNSTFPFFDNKVTQGALIKTTRLTQDFDYKAFQSKRGQRSLPLFLITEAKILHVFATDRKIIPRPGQLLISLNWEAQEEKERLQSEVQKREIAVEKEQDARKKEALKKKKAEEEPKTV